MNRLRQRKFIEFVSMMLFSPVYLLVKLIPKNKNLHIYGSSLGLHFADNSKYLFLYASKNIDKIKSIFISKNKEVVDLLADNGYFAEYFYSMNGIKTVLRARKAFLNHSARDIHPLLLGGAEIIQLWHGTPLKKIGYDADWRINTAKNRLKNGIRRVLYFVFPFLYYSHLFDKIVISSDNIIKSFQTAFGVKLDKLEIVGQPRNDCLDTDYKLDKRIFPEVEYLNSLKNKFDIIVIWLPTHRRLMRKTIIDLMVDYSFNLETFDSFLKENKIGLIAKPHFLEKDTLSDRVKDSDNIVVYDFVDPYPLLKYSDILLTDYSSVYFDFLLTGRPIIFTPFDKEQYCQTETGFYYDYDDVTPGPKCLNWDDIREEIKKASGYLKTSESDPYEAKRSEISFRFNLYKNNFCSRIVDRFFELDS